MSWDWSTIRKKYINSKLISTGKHTLIGGRQMWIKVSLWVTTSGLLSFGMIVTFTSFFPIPQRCGIILLNEVKIILVTVAFQQRYSVIRFALCSNLAAASKRGRTQSQYSTIKPFLNFPNMLLMPAALAFVSAFSLLSSIILSRTP